MRTQLFALRQLALAAALLPMSAGCQDDTLPERFDVRGTVSLDGKPLQAGRILFLPTSATQGPAASARIEDGRYEIAKDAGPVAGNYRVEIEGEVDLGFPLDDDVAFTQRAEAGQKTLPPNPVPAIYNRQSTLTAVISPDESKNQFDFALLSKP
jgi:hypothetical protein